MPRVYTSANDPLDFCAGCFPSLEQAENEYGNVEKSGEGPDGRGNCFEWDAEHPDYGGEDYRCYDCRKRLKAKDNHAGEGVEGV